MPLPVGSHLDHYQILSRIGAGGMGEVYRARDTRLDRLVAIKVLLPERAGREDSKALPRALTFLGVSAAQLTFSVPAPS
jgi:serine/threonine protein kinase